jgi:hypothetical protein
LSKSKELCISNGRQNKVKRRWNLFARAGSAISVLVIFTGLVFVFEEERTSSQFRYTDAGSSDQHFTRESWACQMRQQYTNPEYGYFHWTCNDAVGVESLLWPRVVTDNIDYHSKQPVGCWFHFWWSAVSSQDLPLWRFQSNHQQALQTVSTRSPRIQSTRVLNNMSKSAQPTRNVALTTNKRDSDQRLSSYSITALGIQRCGFVSLRDHELSASTTTPQHLQTSLDARGTHI